MRTPSPTSRRDHKRMLLSELKDDEESQPLVAPQRDLRLKLGFKSRSKSLREDILEAARSVASSSVVDVATEGFSIQELEELKKILKKKQKKMGGT